jgi:hypothetical protein
MVLSLLESFQIPLKLLWVSWITKDKPGNNFQFQSSIMTYTFISSLSPFKTPLLLLSSSYYKDLGYEIFLDIYFLYGLQDSHHYVPKDGPK